MSITLANIKTQLSYRLRDTESGLYTALLSGWIMAGAQRIAAEVPFYHKTHTITCDGILYYWDLADSTSIPHYGVADFLKLHQAFVSGGQVYQLEEHLRGMIWIRDLLALGQLIAGTAQYYAIEGTTLYVDAIPASGTVLTIPYWAKLATPLDAASFPAPLDNDEWMNLLVDAALLYAAPSITGADAERWEAAARMRLYGRGGGDVGEMGRFRDRVSRKTFMSKRAPVLAHRGYTIHDYDYGWRDIED